MKTGRQENKQTGSEVGKQHNNNNNNNNNTHAGKDAA